MALQIRRGNLAEFSGVSLALGELVYILDEKKLFIGGVDDQGARANVDLLANMQGAVGTVNGQDGAVVLYTDDIDETVNPAPTNLWFTNRRAITAVADELVTNNELHSGVNFTYDNSTLVATAVVPTISIDADTTPSLGGNLALSGYNITGTGNINITGGVTITGNISGAVNVTASGVVTITGGSAYIHTDTIKTNNELEIYSTVGKQFTLVGHRGSIASPADTQGGDNIGGFVVKGQTSAGNRVGSAIVTTWESDANFSTSYPKAKVELLIGDNTESPTLAALFDYTGKLSTNSIYLGDGTASVPAIGFTTDGSTDTGIYHPGDGILCISTDATERVRVDSGGMRVDGFMKVKNVNGVLPNPPEAGMIVLDGTTFKGYNGSGWVNLN